MGCCWFTAFSLLVFTLCVDWGCSMITFIPQTSKLPEFRKIAIDGSGRNIYVGGKNIIYHLDQDLTQLKAIETGPKKDSKECTKEDVDREKSGCNIQEYDDYTQLLQVYKPGGILVACGTMYLGRCVGRDLRDISNVNITSTKYLVVSPEATGSTEHVIAKVDTESLLFVGKSYVQTTEVFERIYKQVRDVIYGVRLLNDKFLEPYETDTGAQSTFSIKTVNKHGDHRYEFNVRYMFYLSSYIYSILRITDQTTKRPVSKVSKMCAMQNLPDTNSYEDMPIECSGFPFVQDGFVIQHENGNMLVTLFSSAVEITDTTQCAVCVFTEDELLDGFRKSRLNPPSCENKLENYAVDYLEIAANGKCCSSMTEQTCELVNTTTFCNTFQSLSSFIGVVPLTAMPVYLGQGLTSLGGSFRNNLTTIMVGTQTGTLHKLFLKSHAEARLISSTDYLVNPVQPIIDIVTTELNRIYLLGSYTVAALSEQQVDCSSKQNCSDCMKIPDSKCGWCLLDRGSCMERSSCDTDGFWLPSLGGECLKLHTVPPGIRHQNSSSKTNVTVILSPPVPISGSGWQCQYGTNECKPGGIPCKSDLSISGSTMSCPIVAREAFQEPDKLADFKIVTKSSPSHVLAEGWSILFYDCPGFKTCFECVSNQKAPSCFWNTAAARCSNTQNESFIKHNEISRCPQLLGMDIKLHKDKQQTVVLSAENLPGNMTLYKCSMSVPGTCNVTEVNGTAITCLVNVSADANFIVTYKNRTIDHRGVVATKVYECEDLMGFQPSCSFCVYSSSSLGYPCTWVQSTKKCTYDDTNMADSSICPPPTVDMISPRNGTISGGTSLTITGTELADKNINITVSGRPCEIYNYNFSSQPQWIHCYTGSINTETKGGKVLVTRKNKPSNNNWTFDYLDPELNSIYPINGIQDGGRILTLKGQKLLIGNRDRMTVALFNEHGDIPCHIIPHRHVQKKDSEIICIVGRCRGKPLPYRLTGVNVTYDSYSHVLAEQNINFTFVENPSITIGRSEAIQSGGIDMNITGQRFTAVSIIKVNKVPCQVVSDIRVKCPVPAYNLSQKRRRRSTTTCPCFQHSILHMDNYEYHFKMQYTDNPTLIPFEDVVSYKAGSFLTIEGEYLLRGAVESDYIVKVQTTDCHDVTVNENGTLITFKPPDFLSEGKEYQVEVFVGISLSQHIGVIYYVKDLLIIIIIAALVGVVLIMASLIIYCCIRVRRRDSQVSKLRTDMVEMESNIRNKSREVFADMQMSMQDIKGDLVTTGIPYFDYHNYSFHTLFPKLKAGESIYYETSATRQVEDFTKLAPRGILAFDELLKNKFFLQSLIGTLERQNKFNVQEKAEFSSLLTLTLMGKMTYLSEVIEELLHRLVGGASRKQHRVLFRRSDSITQKLLSNWLALSLYPYLKGGGGQQLFMLYKASQTVMEKGPVDAVTLEAKDTLAEERLLKMDLQYESLTLEVDLNGKKNLRFQCTVLDCDTITQVKAKCMYKIYKNKAASELQFTPEELVLEWHAGKGGKLVLNDIDRTSTKREGYVCRNTLKHYNVKDGSCMALLISDEPEEQELYINSESASMNDVLLSEHSLTSYMSMSPEKQWHLVFPEEDEKESRRHILIEELYLNRLLHTKLTLMEYIDAVFDNVLDEKRVPPVVCYLFKMFESMAKEHNVDSDIVSCWKSECYAMRIWSLWISCPDLLFDIVLAKHVIPCLDVIKSMFSDVFSRTSSKLSKDSSSAKLLFANEVPKFQDKMRMFYEKLGSSCEPVTKQKFVSLMQEVSQKQTQEIRVKKLPALKKLFAMVKKFSDEIIADLDEERETKDLMLGEKFDNVIQQMDTENV